MIHLDSKQAYRSHLKKLRGQISLARREEARLLVVKHLTSFLAPFSSVLSFASMPEEIDLWELNRTLSERNQLLLPKIDGLSLAVYQVSDLKAQLSITQQNLWEPNPEKALLFSLNKIACILIPGLGFDSNKMRLGYGKGHYDRFLKKLDSTSSLKIGVGFKEQLVDGLLPVEPHDQKLDELFLF